MRLLTAHTTLLLLLLCSIALVVVQGNTEKLIFRAKELDSAKLDCVHDEHYHNVQVLKPPYSTVQRVIVPRNAVAPTTTENTQHWYSLDELQIDSSYELRISYPATSPTDFYLKLYRACQDNSGSNRNKRLLLVEGDYAGVSNVPGMDLASITYDIVLENLYLGFLFYQVYKIAAAVAVVLLLGQFVILPKIRRVIQESVASNDLRKQL
ncbi:hypothetical protein BDB00DRAFT_956018 [Zychaea mexicana]|uniref:uncharacterized protein n=1 Tax=Zychaea mexicana TaxID=64656 RepID=UPI0022FDB588|nr:uncharacterized protein BDB00DRAFT_956018 [Zychaea mexicana]KAI9494138.1 hypothetical protein BDB00DRAFT_956018 [Zychaea mexicana]